MNKSYRIRAEIGKEKVVKVNLRQDIDTIEMLSLNISTDGTYKRFSSNKGVLVGRVIVNGGVGVPNAKISIFIPISNADKVRPDIRALYPFTSVNDVDSDGRRYNLLPMTYNDNDHVAVGTFPSPQTVLDNDAYLEIFEKYYKYTTKTNDSGDYMICGVPVGSQMVHMDVDLSDIGFLSQKPYDMISKGYSSDMFESPTKFKDGTNLDLLPQIVTENETVNIYPFWGDESEGEIAITRKDFELQYEITPTCLLIGGVITDNDSNYISDSCSVSEKAGDASQLITSQGKIEMIRFKPDGATEAYSFGGNHMIDENGVFCCRIPMNLDYITTNAKGELVLTEDTTVGIPTRARARFRFTLESTSEDFGVSHSMSHIVPNNPASSAQTVFSGFDVDNYNVLTLIKDDYNCFKLTTHEDELQIEDAEEYRNNFYRDLLWNCVYSVKSYIPRIQIIDDESIQPHIARGANHTGIKGINKKGASDKNPFPYNKLNLDSPTEQDMYGLISNSFFELTGKKVPERPSDNDDYKNPISLFGLISRYIKQTRIRKQWYYRSNTMEQIQNEDEAWGRSMEDNDAVSFDFFNDWVNGTLYFPKVRYNEVKSDENGDSVSVTNCSCGEEQTNLYLNDSLCLDYSATSINKCDEIYLTNDSQSTDAFYVFGGASANTGYINTEFGNDKWNSLNVLGANDFHHRTAEVKLLDGIVYNGSLNNVQQYTYSSILTSKIDDKLYTYCGFKNDIILLGSIDKNNPYGIPFVKSLGLPRSSSILTHMYISDARPNIVNEGVMDLKFSNSGYTPWPDTSFEDQNGYDDRDLNEKENKLIYGTSGVTVSGTNPEEVNYLMPTHVQNGAYWGCAEYRPYITVKNGKKFGDVSGTTNSRYFPSYFPYPFRYEYGPLDWTIYPTTSASTKYFVLNNIISGDTETEYTVKNDELFDLGTHCLLGQGLFFGRNDYSYYPSFYVTKPKTVTNLNRLCELAVSNEDNVAYKWFKDESNNVTTANTLCEMTGVIGEEQIVNHTIRSLFATLNNDKLIIDNSNNKPFKRYSFKYMNINSFDGFLNDHILKHRPNKTNPLIPNDNPRLKLKDRRCDDYVKFRYGEHPIFNSKKDIKSTFNSNIIPTIESYYRFPEFKNSFYFYFGLNPNSTAIDKLYHDYLA